VMSGFEEDLKTKILSVNPEIIVLSKEGRISDYGQVADRIKAMPGVDAVQPYLYTPVMFSTPGNISGGMLRGLDPDLLKAAQARLKAAEARLAAAQTGMQAAEIVAPISGVVVHLNIKQGEEALQGHPLAVVADLTDWVVVVPELGEKDVVSFQPGQELRLSLDAYPQAELNGKVETIGQYYTLDNTDIFYQAKIGLQPSDLPLRWGMTVRIK